MVNLVLLRPTSSGNGSVSKTLQHVDERGGAKGAETALVSKSKGQGGKDKDKDKAGSRCL